MDISIDAGRRWRQALTVFCPITAFQQMPVNQQAAINQFIHTPLPQS
ncbi:hypothetical protein [Dasania marina]|nr:hypothetical protein [Dasania marina]